VRNNGCYFAATGQPVLALSLPFLQETLLKLDSDTVSSAGVPIDPMHDTACLDLRAVRARAMQVRAIRVRSVRVRAMSGGAALSCTV
jgi:hypothetical protein